jgi:nucleotide-binding universal stress UspA family protein
MNSYYNNILIPVDNTLNTQKTLARAITLASPSRSTIHLAQLIHSWNPFARLAPATAYGANSKDALDRHIKILINLMRWKDLVQKQSHIAQVKIHIMRGPSMNLFIQDLAKRTPLDLIIITNDKTGKWLPGAHTGPGDQIARETHCAVLSLLNHKKRGIREEIEMLSEPLTEPSNIINRNKTMAFGLTGAYSKLSNN